MLEKQAIQTPTQKNVYNEPLIGFIATTMAQKNIPHNGKYDFMISSPQPCICLFGGWKKDIKHIPQTVVFHGDFYKL